MTKTEKFLKEKSDLEEIISAIDMDELDIIAAASNQAKMYLRASRYRIQKMRRRIEAKNHLENLESEKALEIRKRDRVKGIKGKTEGNIKQLLRRMPEIQVAIQALSKAEVEEELGKRLLDALDYRGKSIVVISNLIGRDLVNEKKVGDYKEALVGIRKKYPGASRIDDEDIPY